MKRSDFEIMAPVGSWDSLAAAIQAGADSVYLGVGELNMRSASSGLFCQDELPKIVAAAQKKNVKVYLTVNAVLYDQDMGEMRNLIDAAKTAGVSAIIAADVAAMQYCKEIGMPVHLSTQLNIANVQALKFYAQFAEVVVLARELNLKQVKEVSKAVAEQNIKGPDGNPVRIEMFCHGALCMAISGKCYLSLDNAARSANRGKCMQVCRRAYIVKDKERDVELEIDNQYIMSPKDLKTISFLDLLVDAGVRVFKIEGRARGPEYVYTTVSCYNEALQKVIDGQWNEEISKSWDERLSTIYNRGFWNGYYLGQTMGEWSNRYGSQATERKVYAGKAVKYFSKAGVAEFLIQATELKEGDRLLITGPTTGVVYTELKEPWIESEQVKTVKQGDHVTFKVPIKIRENDKLYQIVKI